MCRGDWSIWAFAYGRLNPTTVTDTTQLSQLPFQQLWQATDENRGDGSASRGLRRFFGAFEGTLAQQTLVQNQAYLLDRLKQDGFAVAPGITRSAADS